MNRALPIAKFMAFVLVLFCMVAVSFNSAQADELYGRVRGVVTDPSGAVLPGVHLKLTNTGTGVSQELTSSSDGSYIFVNLIPGTYSLTANKSTFKAYTVARLQIGQSQISVQNVAMELGSATEKQTKITESAAFKMRIDFFNIFNHTNFANPSGNRGSSRFGRITGIRSFTNSRLIQLGADLTF